LENFDTIHGHGHLLIDGNSPDQDFELDLEMNDLLDEFDPADEESDPIELDIFAEMANTTTSVLETSN